MKQIILITFFSITCFCAIAQNSNPYEIFGHNSTVNYETPVTELLYIKNSDLNSEIKAMAFDIENNKVKLLGVNDTLIKEVSIEANQLLRWLSVDPLAKKFPSHSPYNFVTNNPINAIDPDGRDVVFLIDREGAGGNGHMAMLFQDTKGNWFHFSQGAAEQGGTSGMVSNSGYTGGVMIQPMITKNSAGDIIQMTKEQAIAMVNTGRVDGNAYDENITLKTTKIQDGQIYSNAISLQKAYENKEEKYRLISNNCVDAVQDAVQGNKGLSTDINLPSDSWTPKPNSYYDKLKSAVPFMNGEMEFITLKSGLDNFPAKTIAVPKFPTTTTKTTVH
jgi:hypothetical protein